MRKIVSLLVFIQLGALVLACAPKALPEEKPVSERPPVQETQATVKAAWEMEWEKTLAVARKERYLTIGTGREEGVRTGLTQVFKSKYGIDVSWIGGRGDELARKIIFEWNAGLTSFDLHLGGGNTSISTLKRSRVIQSVRDALIMPEVKDEKAWWEGRLPFIDKEGQYVFATTFYPTDTLHANTRLVPNYKEELASYYDLLNPKWKGKILAKDFIRPGGGLKWFSAMIEPDFGPILDMDYMKALVKQEPMPIGDSRIAAEWILRGKYPLGLNLPIDTQFTQWMREGVSVPVASFMPKEGSYITAGGQTLTFMDKAPHPNAAKVFLNWVLTREGQTLLSKLTVKHSSRIDIPEPKDIDLLIEARNPALKYPRTDDEKYLEKTEEYAKLAEEIFGSLYK